MNSKIPTPSQFNKTKYIPGPDPDGAPVECPDVTEEGERAIATTRGAVSSVGFAALMSGLPELECSATSNKCSATSSKKLLLLVAICY